MKISGLVVVIASGAFGCSSKSDEAPRIEAAPRECTKSVEGGFCVRLPPDATATPKVGQLDAETTSYDYRRVTVYVAALAQPDDWTTTLAAMKGTLPNGAADVQTTELPEGIAMQWYDANNAKRRYTNVVLHRGLRAIWCTTSGEEVERAEACMSIRLL